jgi:hypothetical protein
MENVNNIIKTTDSLNNKNRYNYFNIKNVYNLLKYSSIVDYVKLLFYSNQMHRYNKGSTYSPKVSTSFVKKIIFGTANPIIP